MQALVRVQARVRARRVRVALENETDDQENNAEEQTDEAYVREIEVSCTPICNYVFMICKTFCYINIFVTLLLLTSFHKLFGLSC
jgi:hypothetical protein